MKRVKATFTIDEDILQELSEYAAELDIKKSHIIESSLSAFFDYLDVRLAEKRLAEIENGSAELADAEAVWRELDLE
jgi:predicted transcriptional regulator